MSIIDTQTGKRRVRTFATVAAMVADRSLVVGDVVETTEYFAGTGGGNRYGIVAAATGTADGGSFIDITGSSLQAEALWYNGVVEARQFGARGDDSTDDITEINAALAFRSASGSGGDVLLTDGTFVHSTLITIDKKGVRLRGLSMGGLDRSINPGTGLRFTGSGTAIQLTDNTANAWGSSLENIRIDGSATGAGTGAKFGVQLGNADGSPVSWYGAIRNCYITGFRASGGAGVRGFGSQGGALYDTICEFNTRGTSWETNAGNQQINTNSEFTKCSFINNDEVGVNIEHAESLAFRGCRIEGNGFEGIKAVKTTAQVRQILLDGSSWVEGNNQATGRTDGFFEINCTGSVELTLGEKVAITPSFPWNGTTGNRHIYMQQGTLSVSESFLLATVTKPGIILTSTAEIHIRDASGLVNNDDIYPTSEVAWLTTTVYTVGLIREESSKFYHCQVAHTSGVFATDLAANKWIEIMVEVIPLVISHNLQTTNGGPPAQARTQNAGALALLGSSPSTATTPKNSDIMWWNRISGNDWLSGGYMRKLRTIETISSDQSIDEFSDLILVDTSAGSVTIDLIDLFTATANLDGLTYTFIKTSGSNTMTIDADSASAGSRFIDDTSTKAFTTKYSRITISLKRADRWYIVQES